jgi:hypothetical protein
MAGRTAVEIQLGGIKQKFYGKIWACDGSDKAKRLNAADYWAMNPLTIRAEGLGYKVTEDKFIEDDGRRLINTYGPPPWTDGTYDAAAVDKFRDYIAYLLPEPEEADYFLDWLAAKVQDPRFRGTAILMLTDGTQGIGRTTLSKYVGDILGEWNTGAIQFDQMVKDSFNEWVASLVVVVNEVKDSDSKDHRKMEALKNYVDTSPNKVALNVKHGFKGSAETCASFLMFSNHVDALRIAREDRRFTVLRNTDTQDDVMTTDMATWRLNDADYTAEDLYRYLRQRTITNDLYKPLKTVAGELMRIETKGTTDKIVDALARACEQEDLLAIPADQIDHMIGTLFQRLQFETPEKAKETYVRVKKLYFSTAMKAAMVVVNGEGKQPRLVKQVASGLSSATDIRDHRNVQNVDLPVELAVRISLDMKRFDEDAILAIAEDMLSD